MIAIARAVGHRWSTFSSGRCIGTGIRKYGDDDDHAGNNKSSSISAIVAHSEIVVQSSQSIAFNRSDAIRVRVNNNREKEIKAWGCGRKKNESTLILIGCCLLSGILLCE